MLNRPELRLALEERIERHLSAATRLIAALDRLDPDPDLEPSLGWSPYNADPAMVDLELDDSDFEEDARNLRAA